MLALPVGSGQHADIEQSCTWSKPQEHPEKLRKKQARTVAPGLAITKKGVNTQPPNGPETTAIPEVMKLPEICTALDLHPNTAKLLLAKGEIPGWRLGGTWRATRSVFNEWLSQNRSAK
jgi:excisionase family DNA binding protein